MGTTLNYKWVPAHSSVFRARREGATVESLILHSTDGRCGGDIATLTGEDTDNGTHTVSVHWYVTRTGDIYHFVADDDCAFHAGAVNAQKYDNDHSIGIEHEHFDGQEDWPDAQIQASALVGAFLLQQYPDIEVTHHATVAFPAGRKVDPVNFRGDDWWQALGSYEGPIVAIQSD